MLVCYGCCLPLWHVWYVLFFAGTECFPLNLVVHGVASAVADVDVDSAVSGLNYVATMVEAQVEECEARVGRA